MKPILRPCKERTQVYLYRDPVDFRKSHRGLSALVELELGRNPFDGGLYVFTNRQRNKIKCLLCRLCRAQHNRKAWLFADTPGGARASAIYYSLIETAKANGLDPHAYFREVLTQLPYAVSVEKLEALLPWNIKLSNG